MDVLLHSLIVGEYKTYTTGKKKKNIYIYAYAWIRINVARVWTVPLSHLNRLGYVCYM